MKATQAFNKFLSSTLTKYRINFAPTTFELHLL